jgi:hypothetical protein
MAFAASVTKQQADAARAVHMRAREHVRSHVPKGTVLALPTAPCIAPRIDMAGPELEAFRVRVMRLTCIAGMGRLPNRTILHRLGWRRRGLTRLGSDPVAPLRARHVNYSWQLAQFAMSPCFNEWCDLHGCSVPVPPEDYANY